MAFTNDLAHLETAGRLSRQARRSLLRGVAQFLREARGMGLARPGGPPAGLPDDAAPQPHDQVEANTTTRTITPEHCPKSLSISF